MATIIFVLVNIGVLSAAMAFAAAVIALVNIGHATREWLFEGAAWTAFFVVLSTALFGAAFFLKEGNMTTPDAKRIADRYICADGGGAEPAPITAAEAAWRKYAETVHRVLRDKPLILTEEGRLALAAFERIGDAIAEDEKRGRR